jgi:hypothetical protein
MGTQLLDAVLRGDFGTAQVRALVDCWLRGSVVGCAAVAKNGLTVLMRAASREPRACCCDRIIACARPCC